MRGGQIVRKDSPAVGLIYVSEQHDTGKDTLWSMGGVVVPAARGAATIVFPQTI